MNRTFLLASFSVLALAVFAAPGSTMAQVSNRPMRPKAVAPPAAPALPRATTTAPSAPRMPASAYATVPVKKTSAGEQFFIIASLDLQKSELLLKYPTEVTLLVKTTPQTRLVDDSGKSIKVSDLRAGDTVWVTLSGSGDSATASSVRKGQMTVAELHSYYLDYSEIK